MKLVSKIACCSCVQTTAALRLAVLTAFILINGFAFAEAQRPVSAGDDFCKMVTDQRVRSRCYETLNAFGDQAEGYRALLPGGWHLRRTQNTGGGVDFISVTHAADSRKSGHNLAGIIFQCAGGSLDVLMVVIQPYPSRATIDVTLKLDDEPVSSYRGSVVSPGVIIRLPQEAAVSLLRRERSTKELGVQLSYASEPSTKGVVDLIGLAEAVDALTPTCRLP